MKFRFLVLNLVLAGLLVFIPPSSYSAAERVALVIGNGAYRNIPSLRNPVNDAEDMARALERCGFEVIKRVNADRVQMRNAVREFAQAIKGGGVGLFFYAGHGLQVDGENYLVPLGADIKAKFDVEDQCLKAKYVLGAMEEAGNQLNIVILDACRDNPFPSFRSADRGLARMDAPTGSLLVYATAPGRKADDGSGRNGLYTEHFLKNMMTPGMSVTDLLTTVRIGVMQASGRRQVPWETSSLTGKFFFVPTSAAPSPGVVAPTPVIVSPPPAPAPAPAPQVAAITPSAADATRTLTGLLMYANGIILDPNTNLEWYPGPDRDTEWEEADQWVRSLSLYGGGWRLPTNDELRGLYKRGVGSRNMDPAFEITGWFVWSDRRDPSLPGGLYFNFEYDKSAWYNRNVGHRAFAVRSRRADAGPVPAPVPAPSPQVAAITPSAMDATRTITGLLKYANGIIFDPNTNLEWYAGPDRDTTWDVADQWVRSLSVAGGGWRMPTRDELRGLYKKGVGSRNMDPAFETTGWWVWSETMGSTSAWMFSFDLGDDNYGSRISYFSYASNGRAFAVRSRK